MLMLHNLCSICSKARAISVPISQLLHTNFRLHSSQRFPFTTCSNRQIIAMPPRQSSRIAKGAVIQTSSTEVAVTKTNGTSIAKTEAKSRRVTKREGTESILKPEPESKEEVKPAAAKKRKAATAVKTKVEDEDSAAEEEPKSAPKKRKTAKSKTKPEDLAPLAARTVIASLKKAMYVGAHVSSAGGMWKLYPIFVAFSYFTCLLHRSF